MNLSVNWKYFFSFYEGGSSEGHAMSVIYDGYKIDVWWNALLEPTIIRLYPRNIIPTGFEMSLYAIRKRPVNFSNMNFYVYKLLCGYIVGVALQPQHG